MTEGERENSFESWDFREVGCVGVRVVVSLGRDGFEVCGLRGLDIVEGCVAGWIRGRVL